MGSQTRPSAGMQYVQRKLHLSVTEIRRSSAIRPKVSSNGPAAGIFGSDCGLGVMGGSSIRQG